MLEFIKSAILVTVPVITGSYATYQLTHSWQNYQFKIKIKYDLINICNESIEKNLRLQWSLFREMFVKYSGTEERNVESGKISAIVIFPTDPKERPAQVFTNEYDSYKKEISNVLHKTHFLGSNLKLYVDGGSLVEELDGITSHLSRSSTILRNFMKPTLTEDEFYRYITEIDNKLIENQKMINVFMNKIIKVKIKKIPV